MQNQALIGCGGAQNEQPIRLLPSLVPQREISVQNLTSAVAQNQPTMAETMESAVSEALPSQMNPPTPHPTPCYSPRYDSTTGP